MISDEQARTEALNPQGSYIVQAPAGSGKTELLTRRYLTLLAHVSQPEEILAVTFTNKAAGEMSARIIKYLQTPAYQKLDRWEILKNPNRLRIVTIDAFCGYLATRLPLLSRFGCQPDIVDEPAVVYENAANALLSTLEADEPWSSALQAILSHMDNRFDRLQDFFVQLLAKRDQWLPIILNLDGDLTGPIISVINETLEKVTKYFIDVDEIQLISLIQHAFEHVDQTHPLLTFERPTCFPQPDSMACNTWKLISFFLLTKEGKWRKQINKTLGFLPKVHDQQKNQFKALLADLSAKFEPDLLYSIQSLPDPTYSDSTQVLVEHLKTILPVLIGYLKVQFKEIGQVDFIEVAEGALSALGELDDPSDLALMLDYQMKHILIDEFQDTSVSQYSLFEKLLAGWSPHDGKTLFLVGDPMQSIYHFRGAEVGLFIKAREQGIADIQLTPLYLTENFRSSPVLVEAYNHIFQPRFPATDDLSIGAIKFHAAVSSKPNDEQPAGVDAIVVQGTHKEEADWVALQVSSVLGQYPDETIGIIARTKKQLTALRLKLQQLRINFNAEQLERLANRQVILDLEALTLALHDTNDTLSWCAVLRAPWCGLTLDDLFLLREQTSLTLWDALCEPSIISLLSQDAQARLATFIPLLRYWQYVQGKVSLRHWVESLWYRLGGPACLESASAAQDAEVFFQLLETLDHGCQISDQNLFKKRLSQLFAEEAVQQSQSKYLTTLLTIHKAKGLEFDRVFLLGLNERRRTADPSLFVWWERPTLQGVDILFAPNSGVEEKNLLYHFLVKQIGIKQAYEQVRLLYVAMTRAKQQLFLVTHTPELPLKPAAGSFLSTLRAVFKAPQVVMPEKVIAKTEVEVPLLKRMHQDWQSPFVLPTLTLPIADEGLNHPDGLNQADPLQRLIGIVVHRIFYEISETGYKNWQGKSLNQYTDYWHTLLIEEGVPETTLAVAFDTVIKAVKNFLSDKKMAWVFSNSVTEGRNEWSLCDTYQDRVRTHIIDRTFIDHNNRRWILDYKILNQENETTVAIAIERYQKQLARYRQLLYKYDQREAYVALYFPLEQYWWDNCHEEPPCL